MAFYITNPTGTEMQKGKRFETFECAVLAATKSARTAQARSTHGTTPFDVMEEIPGRHATRAIVYADRVDYR